MISAGTHGAVTWIDLSTPDVDAAAAFYRELLGWTDVLMALTPMGDYHLGKIDDFQVCGMMGQSGELAGTPPVWTMFVYVDDVDGTAECVAGAGGTVLSEPMDIPEARIAVVADPAGAALGLFGGPSIEGEYYSTDAGRVCWAELMSRDSDGVEGFYSELFRWVANTQSVPAPGGDYTIFRIGEDDVAGMMAMPDEVPDEVPSYWGAYFAVDDCAATEAEAVRLGGQVYKATTDVGDGRFATLADPQGATFGVFERR